MTKTVVAHKNIAVYADLAAISGLEYVHFPLHAAPASGGLMVEDTDVFTNVASWPTLDIEEAPGTIGTAWSANTGWFTGQGAANDVGANGATAAVMDFVSLNNFGSAGGSIVVAFQADSSTWTHAAGSGLCELGATITDGDGWNVEIQASEKLFCTVALDGVSVPTVVSTGTAMSTTNGYFAGTGGAGSVHACIVVIDVNTDGTATISVKTTGVSSSSDTTVEGDMPGVGTTYSDANGFQILSGMTNGGAINNEVDTAMQISDLWFIRYPGKSLTANAAEIFTAFESVRAEPPRNLAAVLSA